jgi:streptogramin lyase
MRGHTAVVALCVALSVSLHAQTVVEYQVAYKNEPTATDACHPTPKGSTHEITFNANGGNSLWITGQTYDSVVQVTESGAMTFYSMPPRSGPHGIEFDRDGRLWVSLEFSGQIVRLNSSGAPDLTFDVRLDCPTCPGGEKINTRPHGMSFGPDGKTIWFTGKATGTVGKVTSDGKMTTYTLHGRQRSDLRSRRQRRNDVGHGARWQCHRPHHL